VEIHASARRHGIGDDDMRHACAHSLIVEDLSEDPDRWLVIDPDRAGNFVEIVVLVTQEGIEMINHAMPMRPIYQKLLER
jgi:hypothetical protein